MTMTSISQVGATPAGTETADDEMEKIRELLVGEFQRRSAARIEVLEARLKELDEEMGRRFDTLIARIEALGRETTTSRHAAFEELSRNVLELGERIRNLSNT